MSRTSNPGGGWLAVAAVAALGTGGYLYVRRKDKEAAEAKKKKKEQGVLPAPKPKPSPTPTPGPIPDESPVVSVASLEDLALVDGMVEPGMPMVMLTAMARGEAYAATRAPFEYAAAENPDLLFLDVHMGAILEEMGADVGTGLQVHSDVASFTGGVISAPGAEEECATFRMAYGNAAEILEANGETLESDDCIIFDDIDLSVDPQDLQWALAEAVKAAGELAGIPPEVAAMMAPGSRKTHIMAAGEGLRFYGLRAA